MDLRVHPDNATMDEAIASALRAVEAITELDRLARDVAAAKLLSEYNSSWRHYSRADGRGCSVEVTDPELSELEFRSRLTLSWLGALGATCYEFGYDDDRMFAGHSVVVISFNGVHFTDSHAELFG